jgi:hypothetical protein
MRSCDGYVLAMVAFLQMICYPATEKSGLTAADPIEETGWMKFQTLACPAIKISA